MEITCIPWLTLISKILAGKGSRNIQTFIMIFPVRKHLPTQETGIGFTLL